MTQGTAGRRAAPTSDKAVQARTGKTWPEWLAVLDAADARDMTHQQIVAYLGQHYPEVSAWWQQSVTVAYEQHTGRRELHQAAEGYQVSVGRTYGAGVDTLFNAWQDPDLRAQWLPEAQFTVSRATPGKSIRMVWGDGTRVEVNLYARGAGKGQMTVQQSRLPGAEAAAQARAGWTAALERLRGLVEG
ncbi:MAG: hypothetical protein HY532_04570 [Chloroflexi bacterium]|nr:hypothetical protein [Chloroflexota bacterium]